MSDSECDTGRSETTDGTAAKANVMPTASDQLAQLIADAEADLSAMVAPSDYWRGWVDCTTMFLRRLKAINEVQQCKPEEEGIPTS